VSRERRPASLLAGLSALTAVGASLAQGSWEEIDRLRWLESPTDEGAVAWARATTAASTEALTGRASYRETLGEMQRALDTAPFVSDIALLGPYAVRFRRDARHPKGVLQRADRSGGSIGPWRAVLDVDELSRREGADYDLQWSSERCLAPAFDRCLLSFGVAGSDQAVLREFDLAAAQFVAGGFALPASQHVVAWLNRDAIVVGHDLAGAPRTAAHWPGEAHLWRRGTPLQTSHKVFAAAPTDALFQLYPLGPDRALLAQTVNFSTYILHVIDVDGTVRRLALPDKLKPFGFQGATARHLFVQLAQDATFDGLQIPAESIVSYDYASQHTGRPRVAIVYAPTRGEVISSLGFSTTQSRVLFPVVADMRVRLLSARFDEEEWRVEQVERAEPGVNLRVTGADPNGEEFALLKEGFLTPPSIQLLRPNGSRIDLDHSRAGFDASTHAIEVRSARASDGESIDYLLIAPKQRRGPVPTLMTGYGAFGISLAAAYPTTATGQFYGGPTLQLWFQRGGALVVPVIRGGGERGEAWHRAAMGENRQRSYDDFIAVASDAVRLGITDRRHLGVFGTSNGGLLAAVVGVQRPDLFSAVVADAPLADMLRFTQMGGGAAWTEEYGDPNDPHAAAFLARYSPLHNLGNGIHYPAFFISVAATDNVVGPGHARKLARRLAHLKARVFFLEAQAGGHQVSDPLLRPEMMAMRATFLFDELFEPRRGEGSSPDAGFVKWAQARAVPLSEIETTASRLVEGARVVALGEPAHGAHEPLAFRNRLFTHLVEKLGFTAIAIESGLSESRRVNEFVLGGTGDARELARDNLTWGFGDYAENVELLRWLRQYNAHSPLRKVRFYGIDLSGGSDADFTTARVSLEDALAYLERFAPDLSRRKRADLDGFLNRFTRQKYLALAPAEKPELSNAIDRLIGLFGSERARLIAASSSDEFAWAERNAIVARQTEELFRLWPADTPAEGVSAEFERAAAARDAAMADNVQWALRREGDGGRILVFAHNAHVMNGELRGGVWSVYRKPPPAMGQHLRAALGKDLVIIGTASTANGRGLPQDTNRGTVENALRSVSRPPFLLDLRSATDMASSSPWFTQLQSMRANFTTQMLISPQSAFDALILLEPLTPACGRDAAQLLDSCLQEPP
jgi:prolyl oligopeptidase